MKISGVLMINQEGQSQKLPFPWVSNENGLYALVALSLALKSVLFSLTEIISNDGPRYIYPAYTFLEGNWLEAIKSGTFLYSLLIAALGSLGLDLVLAGELISLVSSVLVLVPLYRFFSGIANRQVAFWGCLVFAVSPSLNRFSVSVMRDPLFLLVFVWLIYFAWRALEEKKWRYFVWVSLLSVLSPLLRLEGLLFLPVFFLAMVFKGASDAQGRRVFLKRAGLSLSLLALVCLVCFVVLPNNGFNLSSQPRVQQVLNAFDKISARGFFYSDPLLDKKLQEMQQVIPGGVSSNNFADVARNHVLLIYFIGFVSVVAYNLWPPFFLALLLGLGRLSRLGKGRFFFLCLVFAYSGMAYWYSINYGFLDERYVYVPVTLLCAGAGLGFERLTEIVRRFPFSNLILSCLLLAVVAVPIVQAVKREAKPEALSSRQAGEWLAKQPELQDFTLLANGEKMPFYAGRRGDFVHAEFWNMPQLEKYIGSQKVDLISIESRKSNLDRYPIFSGYRLIAKFEDQRHCSLIYRQEQ